MFIIVPAVLSTIPQNLRSAKIYYGPAEPTMSIIMPAALSYDFNKTCGALRLTMSLRS